MEDLNELKSYLRDENKKKIDELIDVLDPNIKYNIIFTRNAANYSILLQQYKMDDTILDKTTYVMYGKVVMVPTVLIEGSFIVMLVIISRDEFNRFRKEYNLLVYEAENFEDRITSRRR